MVWNVDADLQTPSPAHPTGESCNNKVHGGGSMNTVNAAIVMRGGVDGFVLRPWGVVCVCLCL